MKILAKEIEMIAHFKANGLIVPYRFRIAGEDDETHVVKVSRVNKTEAVTVAGAESIIYDCQSEINDTVRLYCLKYRINEHRWELYRM